MWTLRKQKKIELDFIPEISNNIAIIIPTTSNKRNYSNIEDMDFFKIMYSSFLKTMNKDKKYNYNFYLGYDDDDTFYINNREKIIEHFKKLNSENSIELHSVTGMKSKVGQIWSFLADIAKEKNHFLYQLGDDIELITSGWEDVFIDTLKKRNYIGVTGPKDLTNPRILTQSFVHKIHLEIFKSYYPEKIYNWYIDDWITFVYGKRAMRFSNMQVINRGGEERYKTASKPKTASKELKEGKIILKKYLTKHRKLE